MRRLCIVPRWGGGPNRDFYPWLRAALSAKNLHLTLGASGRLSAPFAPNPRLFDEVLSPEMPAPDTPTIEAWVARIGEVVGRSPSDLSDTVFLGHSVGCQAVLRFLSSLPEGSRARGALLVAAWFEVDRPWETLRPWMDTPIHDAAARAAGGEIVVLISDNDPFTSDFAKNRRLWEERVSAEVVLSPGRRHFNEAEEPAVLSLLVSRFGELQEG